MSGSTLILSVIALLGTSGYVVPAAPAAVAGQYCLDPSDEDDFREFVIETLVTEDSAELHYLGLAPVDTSAVVFVTAADSVTCRLAAEAHARHHGDDITNPPPVYVLRVGATRYFVFNYTKMGEYHIYSIFDQDFEHVDNWRG
jgi:hypothetical protein